ncbi:uncharacterized protein At4g22758 [Cornus florida]|uniref:uncharacterized protein At4g22758 n=1 Tax=Cornus florida TaxID=4283 RepID=UPI00289A0F60|nr:uncharacterized protein At4g22758 [Cornus florida]
MSTSKNHRRGREESRKSRLGEKSSSFHGRSLGTVGEKLLRPRTVPDLLAGGSFAGVSLDGRPKLTKLLLNVTVQRSLGAVQVLMAPESTVGDLIAAALRQYGKEGRRPTLAGHPSGFDLHYSQFSLESLDREEKLITLGSRNLYICPKTSATESGGGGGGVASSSCSKEAEEGTKIGVPWLKFMNFLL